MTQTHSFGEFAKDGHVGDITGVVHTFGHDSDLPTNAHPFFEVARVVGENQTLTTHTEPHGELPILDGLSFAEAQVYFSGTLNPRGRQ
jgi:hypothetical protein